ncbi:hypothetical protein D3C84_921200 [compost metagenome]
MGCQGFDRAGLGQPRQAFEQYMTIGQQPQQHMPNGFGLPQHLLRNTRLQRGYLLTYAHCVVP